MEFNSEMRLITELILISLLLVFVTPFMLHLGTGILPGINSFTVTTGSMEPNISTGSVIYTHQVANFSKIEIGDVITFEEGDQYVTHRVHDTRGSGDSIVFITKGDRNEDPDSEPVDQERVVGKVFLTLPMMGRVVQALGSKKGLVVFVILPAGSIILIEIENIRRSLDVKN